MIYPMEAGFLPQRLHLIGRFPKRAGFAANPAWGAAIENSAIVVHLVFFAILQSL
jgi:hypothetical protein